MKILCTTIICCILFSITPVAAQNTTVLDEICRMHEGQTFINMSNRDIKTVITCDVNRITIELYVATHANDSVQSFELGTSIKLVKNNKGEWHIIGDKIKTPTKETLQFLQRKLRKAKIKEED